MLNSYLHRLYNTINSRGYIEVEEFVSLSRSNRRGSVTGRLKFYDSSFLNFGEVLLVRNRQIIKLRYRYHYQKNSGEVIFRYDNAPHYPGISTFPHHKHVGATVEPTQPPDLNEVIREIEQMLSPSG
jgi:hypothetical protein